MSPMTTGSTASFPLLPELPFVVFAEPRQAIQEPVFLCLMQILKAVAMGVVAACGVFWVR